MERGVWDPWIWPLSLFSDSLTHINFIFSFDPSNSEHLWMHLNILRVKAFSWFFFSLIQQICIKRQSQPFWHIWTISMEESFSKDRRVGGDVLRLIPVLLWESNTIADLTGGRAQVVIWAMGSGCKYKWSFACWPTANLLSKNTGVGSLSLLQGNFPTQESNLGLLHCRWILYQLSHPGSPIWAMGSSCQYSWSSTRWPTTNLLLCVTQFLTGHGLVLVHALEVGDPGIEYLLCFTDVNEEGAPLWGIAF